MHGDITGPERIHHFDFQTIRIFRIDIIRIHPAKRSGTPNDRRAVRIEWAQALVHRPVPVTELVQDVADGGHVEMLSNPGKAFGIGRWWLFHKNEGVTSSLHAW